MLQFFVGLNNDYKVARGSILIMKPLPDIDQVYNMTLQEEKQRSLIAVPQFSNGSTAFNASTHVSLDQSVFAAQQRSYNTGYQTRSFNTGNNSGNTNLSSISPYKNNARFENQERRQSMYCEHCKMTGHTVQRCYKIHGYPPGHRFYKGKRVAPVAQTEPSSSYNMIQSQDQAHPAVSSSISQSSAPPSFTQEQYNQLWSLLSQHSSNQDRVNNDNMEQQGSLQVKFFVSLHILVIILGLFIVRQVIILPHTYLYFMM